jgi:hypothetical protein
MEQFKKHLPENLHTKIMGKYVSELKGNFTDIVAKSKSVIEEVNLKLDSQVTRVPA